MSDQSIRGAAAFVGLGLAGVGLAPGYSHLDLIGLAVHGALQDAGISLGEVDGLFTANMVNILPTLAVVAFAVAIWPRVRGVTAVPRGRPPMAGDPPKPEAP